MPGKKPLSYFRENVQAVCTSKFAQIAHLSFLYTSTPKEKSNFKSNEWYLELFGQRRMQKYVPHQQCQKFKVNRHTASFPGTFATCNAHFY